MDEHSDENSRLDDARLRIVLATVLINVVSVGLFNFIPRSDWRTGTALNLFDNAFLAAFAWRRKDAILWHLLVFGLVVGVVELAADAWLVDSTKTLDYSVGGGPMLWRSPIWMPIAWQIVTVQFAVIGHRLIRYDLAAGLLATSALGAVNIPYYEAMARRIHWWQYAGCKMILGAPYYIILAEFLIAGLLGWMGLAARKTQWPITIGAGVLSGIAIFAACGASFSVVERL